MSGRHHSKAVKLGATVLARLAGEQAAAETFGIDRRTIRGWLKNEDVPTDSWAALDDLAGAQLLERVARGEVRNPTTLATVRGIASRNRRYAELIAKREERRTDEACDCVLPDGWVKELHPKPGTPAHAAAVWQIAAAKMGDSRRHFMHSLRPLLAFLIDREDDETLALPEKFDIPEAREATAAAIAGIPKPDGDPVAAMQQWIESLDDETVAARQALVDAAWDAYRDALQGELQRRRDDEATAAPEYDARRGPPSEPEPTDTPDAPTPIRRATSRPAPSPMVFDVGREDHDRGWRPYSREDNW